MKVVCSICGVEDWPAQIRNWHGTGRCVSTVVVNRPAATNSSATNTVATNRTSNRRSREAYNAYQREYMRKRRGRQA